jgi:hypothetical protein
MKKNIDYMKDPRMSDLKDAPYPVQEVYAWRLAVQDETEGMTSDQRRAYYKASREETIAFCAKHGLGHLHYADE